MGWILVTLEETGCRGSCERRHGLGVNNGVKRGSEEDCYLKVAQGSRKGGSALQSLTCFWSAFGVVLTDFDDLRVCEAVAAGDRAARTLLFDTLDK